jgi:hypothetical protein
MLFGIRVLGPYFMAAAITDVKAWRVGGEESFMSKTDYLIVFYVF